MRRLLFLLGAAAAFAVAGCASSPRAVRLASYNIRHGAGADGKVDFQRVADVLAREKPDFVGLNEVDCRTERVGGVDTPAELGKLLGLHATFGEAMPYRGGSYGNAVLSRESPLAALRVPLPGKEPRALLLCEFRDFWFGTMHLDFGDYQRQAVEVVRGVVAERAKSKPVFLAGDWNATPDSATLKALKEFLTVVSKENALTFHNFKETANDYCIDYIAVDSGHAPLVAVKEAHATPDFVASDHNPIAVELALGGTAR